jgi:hypothetical protein
MYAAPAITTRIRPAVAAKGPTPSECVGAGEPGGEYFVQSVESTPRKASRRRNAVSAAATPRASAAPARRLTTNTAQLRLTATMPAMKAKAAAIKGTPGGVTGCMTGLGSTGSCQLPHAAKSATTKRIPAATANAATVSDVFHVPPRTSRGRRGFVECTRPVILVHVHIIGAVCRQSVERRNVACHAEGTTLLPQARDHLGASERIGCT